MTDRRLWDVLGAWRAEGLWALVDKRKHKQSNPLAGVDARIIEAILDQHTAEIDDSTGSLDRFHRRVQNRLDAKHGEKTVQLPSRATFHRYTQLLLGAGTPSGPPPPAAPPPSSPTGSSVTWWPTGPARSS